MITRDLTERQLDELYEEMSLKVDPRRPRKMPDRLYPKAKGRPRHEIAEIAKADEDTISHYVKRYTEGRPARVAGGQ